MSLLRILGRAFLAVIALGASAIGFAYARTEYLARHRVEPPPPRAIAVRMDSASLARGRHLATTIAGCAGCHGADLGGDTVINEPLIARLTSSNLTTGDGGVLARYSDAQLAAAIRHGVAPDGRVLRFMPSHEFAGLADDDVAAIITYLRSLAPVDRRVAPISIGPVMRVLATYGDVHLFPYYMIDHDTPPMAVAPSGPTVATGKYIVNGCVGCHGPRLSGGPIPGAPPDWPAAANLTPAGIGAWSEADFIGAMRTGTRPDGTRIRPPMPWKELGGMTDDELIAVRRYLATLPPLPTGTR